MCLVCEHADTVPAAAEAAKGCTVIVPRHNASVFAPLGAVRTHTEAVATRTWILAKTYNLGYMEHHARVGVLKEDTDVEIDAEPDNADGVLDGDVANLQGSLAMARNARKAPNLIYASDGGLARNAPSSTRRTKPNPPNQPQTKPRTQTNKDLRVGEVEKLVVQDFKTETGKAPPPKLLTYASFAAGKELKKKPLLALSGSGDCGTPECLESASNLTLKAREARLHFETKPLAIISDQARRAR